MHRPFPSDRVALIPALADAVAGIGLGADYTVAVYARPTVHWIVYGPDGCVVDDSRAHVNCRAYDGDDGIEYAYADACRFGVDLARAAHGLDP